MATIAISDLHPAGSELFSDSETFMTDLVNSELGEVSGGGIGGIIHNITSRLLSAAAATAAPAVSFVASVAVTGVVAYTVLRN